jgi:hypothetical protein
MVVKSSGRVGNVLVWKLGHLGSGSCSASSFEPLPEPIKDGKRAFLSFLPALPLHNSIMCAVVAFCFYMPDIF